MDSEFLFNFISFICIIEKTFKTNQTFIFELDPPTKINVLNNGENSMCRSEVGPCFGDKELYVSRNLGVPSISRFNSYVFGPSKNRFTSKYAEMEVFYMDNVQERR